MNTFGLPFHLLDAVQYSLHGPERESRHGTEPGIVKGVRYRVNKRPTVEFYVELLKYRNPRVALRLHRDGRQNILRRTFASAITRSKPIYTANRKQVNTRISTARITG